MRGKWVDRGVIVRRMTVQGGDGMPAGVEVQPGLRIGNDFGPQQFFEGTDVGALPTSPGYGFIAYENDDFWYDVNPVLWPAFVGKS